MNPRPRKKTFLDYCKKVWNYLEQEFMVQNAFLLVDEEDISYYFKDKYNVQDTAFMIKEILPDIECKKL